MITLHRTRPVPVHAEELKDGSWRVYSAAGPVRMPAEVFRCLFAPATEREVEAVYDDEQRNWRGRYNWIRGERMWLEGATARDIATELGCSEVTVRKHAYREHWARAKIPPDRRREQRETQQKFDRMVLEDSVICPSCDKATLHDPCSHCHVHLPSSLAR